MQVLVRDNNVDQALKALKKKMQREGIFREMKLRGHYEKPSEKRRARRRKRSAARASSPARMQREGLLPMKALVRFREPVLVVVLAVVARVVAAFVDRVWAKALCALSSTFGSVRRGSYIARAFIF